MRQQPALEGAGFSLGLWGLGFWFWGLRFRVLGGWVLGFRVRVHNA